MGLGVPPGPPLVRASINPRTTVLLLAVPNSSKVYLEKTSYLKKQMSFFLMSISNYSCNFWDKQDIYSFTQHLSQAILFLNKKFLWNNFIIMKIQSKGIYFYSFSERMLEFGINNKGNSNKGQSSGFGNSKNRGKGKIWDSSSFSTLRSKTWCSSVHTGHNI